MNNNNNNEHIMNRVTNYVHYATYSFNKDKNFFVDIMMNLKTKQYEIYLFNKNCTVKSFLDTISFEYVNSDEDIIDQLCADWDMAAFDYEHAFEKQYNPCNGDNASSYYNILPCSNPYAASIVTNRKASMSSRTNHEATSEPVVKNYGSTCTPVKERPYVSSHNKYEEDNEDNDSYYDFSTY